MVSPSVRICLHVCCAVYFSVTHIRLVILCNPFAAIYNKVSFFISTIHVIYCQLCVLEAGPVWTCYGELTRYVAAILLVLYEHVIQSMPLQICSQTTHVIRYDPRVLFTPVLFIYVLHFFWECLLCCVRRIIMYNIFSVALIYRIMHPTRMNITRCPFGMHTFIS